MWHAYKYCVTQVVRTFHSCAWYAIRGTLNPGDQVPTNPSLRSYELTLAALLQLPGSLRDRVRAMSIQWAALHESDLRTFQIVATDASTEQSHQGSVTITLVSLCRQQVPFNV